jgi:enoyl-[acyl-carrier protein] reductase II
VRVSIKKLTDKPFGAGYMLMMPGAKENADIDLDGQVPVIDFFLGEGDWLVKKLMNTLVRLS